MTQNLEHVQVKKEHPWGALELGQICADGVITACGLQARHSLHYIHMDATGNRAGWTLMRNPGVFEIKCADNVAPNSTGIDIECLSGNIRLEAPNGRIILSAKDIDIMANGEDRRGNICIEANSDVKIKAGKHFDLLAESGYRLFSPNIGRIIANTKMSLVSNFIDGLTSGCSTLAGKTDPTSSARFLSQSLY